MNTILFWCLFGFGSLAILDCVSPLEISDYNIKIGVYASAIFLFILYITKSINTYKLQIRLISFLLCGSASAFLIFVNRNGNWTTQQVLYTHISNSDRQIELQNQLSLGSFSRKVRLVKNWKLIPMLSWVEAIQQTEIDTTNWIKQ